MAATSRKPEGIQQDCQAEFWAGGSEVSSWVFHQAVKNEWLDIVEGSAPSKMKGEATNNSLRAKDVGALTTFRTFPHTGWRKMVVIHVDWLAPYQGTAQGEQP
jgi:hypothetical protein